MVVVCLSAGLEEDLNLVAEIGLEPVPGTGFEPVAETGLEPVPGNVPVTGFEPGTGLEPGTGNVPVAGFEPVTGLEPGTGFEPVPGTGLEFWSGSCYYLHLSPLWRPHPLGTVQQSFEHS